jgi:hypothetical protein
MLIGLRVYERKMMRLRLQLLFFGLHAEKFNKFSAFGYEKSRYGITAPAIGQLHRL